jgi:hypothetical protein
MRSGSSILAGARVAPVAVPLAVASLLTLGLPGATALAQTSGGSGAGGSSAGGSSSPGGATGAGSSVGTGGAAAPGGTVTPPSMRTPSTGPQSRSPAMRPSPVPQVDTGNPPVPSAGNAEPSSPIYRQDMPPGALTPQPDATNPAGTGTDGSTATESRTPQTDAPPGGSGGASGARTGAGSGGDALIPSDPSGSPAESGSGRTADSITEEPNRVTRGGAAGKNLDECMKLWDPSTHMTKEQWKTTCERLGR